MHRFQAQLVPGSKAPYDTWTFVVVPERVVKALGKGRCEVRGTLGGEPFRGTVAKGEGVHRMPVKRALLDALGLARGDAVAVTLELDPEPRPVALPAELEGLLAEDPDLARGFEALAPSMRRAWASYVGDAKRAETRARRLAQAPDGIRRRAFPRS